MLAVLAVAGLTLAGGASGGGAAVAATGPTAGAGEGAAPGCTMRRHSKRVTRHVHRHGKPRTLHRTRYWWSCEPPAAAPSGSETAAPSAPPAPDPGPAPNPTPEPETPEPELAGNHLGVKAVEYSYTLSRSAVSAGEVTVELDNRGQDAHNLNLQKVGGEEPPQQIEETGSLQRRSAHFDLEPGVYRLWCSLPTHDEEGMHATVVVEAP